MHDVLPQLIKWWDSDEPVGVVTVVATFRSAPRLPGASMVVGPDGTAVGSVSGGCVEGSAYDLAQEVIRTGVPILERYGVSDEDAFAVGLTCGGVLDLFIERVDRTSFPELREVAKCIENGNAVAIATIIEHRDRKSVGRRLVIRLDAETNTSAITAPTITGSLGSRRIDDAVRNSTLGLLAAGRSGVLELGPDGERTDEGTRVFVRVFTPPPRMVVFGAIDFAGAVARLGRFLGYHVTVCDARPVFATKNRFPDAHEVVVEWPHRYLKAEYEAGRIPSGTVVTVLTHDPKFDITVLKSALQMPELAYIGAMGSRRTHDDRLELLRAAGLTDNELSRLRSPIGLDLGARTPEETAISIAAEIISSRWGGTGEPLTRTEGPIHHLGSVGGPRRTETTQRV